MKGHRQSKKKKEKDDESKQEEISSSLIPGFVPDGDDGDDEDAGDFEGTGADLATKDVNDHAQEHHPGGMPIIAVQALMGHTYLAIPSHDGTRE
jgi:hypothetical protein